MQEVVMQTAETDATRESNERVVLIVDSTYVKYELDKVATAEVHIDKNVRKKLWSLLT